MTALEQDCRVLLVDDNSALCAGYARAFTSQGWTVQTAKNGLEGKEQLDRGAFDVVVSDINMPGYGGITFLQYARERNPDIPVVLITGNPTVDSSIAAIEHGVFRYLVKPVSVSTLVGVIRRAALVGKLSILKRRALEIAELEGKWLGDRAELERRFTSALEHLWVAFQPIVCWTRRNVFGYEALLRSGEPTLASPLDLLAAAERLGRLHDVGRAVRARVADAAERVPPDGALFVNLHASDLYDEDLFDSHSPLARVAQRVVLEITERASLDEIKDVSARIKQLKQLGFRIAVDDLGAGYAGLTSFAQLEPDVAKLDMSLVRGIDSNPRKQSIVRSMQTLCNDLHVQVIVEGVETSDERDTLLSLGCELLQGYLFARPARGFSPIQWER